MRRSALRAAGAAAVLATAVLTAGAPTAAARTAAPAAGARPASGPPPATSVSAPPASPYPAVGAGTSFVDRNAVLAGFSDAAWYKANIPFLDVPDRTIQDVYYYRWRTWKEHLRYTDPQDGWISTEFLDCCGYAAPYQAIDAAAGHQITESRWVRDQQYGDDYVKFWLTGPGAGPKPATDEFNADTTDWAHEYSFWLASAAYGRAEATGDFTPLIRMLPQLERQWHGWDKQFDPKLGLYWSVPVWDAMEYSASSYQSSDPYHGGAGYRPTLNSYQYGDAVAISRIATMAGDRRAARYYARRAAALKRAMQRRLWDPNRAFYYDVARDGNPGLAKLDTREEIGYLPWMFGAAEPQDAAAWAQLTDPQGFASPYGPTTAERRSPWFMHDAGTCCRWDGPSWPFATSQTLTALANLIDDYPAQPYADAGTYDALLHTYAATQYRNGVPYVAEAHSPDTPQWIYDSYDHSEDYNHSTYTDLVISGLMGLRPSAGNVLRIDPLVPASWDHFVLENVPYHGHNITLAYDRDGTHYGFGTGWRVFVDGRVVVSRPTVSDTVVRLPGRPAAGPAGHAAAGPAGRPAPHLVNDAANPLRTGYPKPIASYTWRYDDPWNAIDGKVWFNEVPEDTRWTNYASPNATDYYGVDFGVPTVVDDIRWYGYDDGGGVRPAASYRLQYWTGSQWLDVPGQTRAPTQPVGNGMNRITFAPLVTSRVRLLFTDPPGAFVGVTELQSWSESDQQVALGVGPRSSNGDVLVDGATTVTVTARNETHRALTAATASLAVPAGWSASAAAGGPGVLLPGGTARWRVTVTPPPGTAAGTVTDVAARLAYRDAGRALTTHARQQMMIAFPPGRQDPVASWNLDEGSGSTAHDGSGGGHDLTLTGGPQWVPGHTGTALHFDGQGQYAATAGPVLDTVGNFTVSAWVRLDSTSSWATAVSQDGTTTSGFFLQYSLADDRLAFSTGEGRALSDAAPVTGRWYHLVGVHDADAGTYTLYVDGVAQHSVLHQAQGDPANGPTAVGRAFSGGADSDFWPGTIDDVTLWNRALSPAAVAGLDTPAT